MWDEHPLRSFDYQQTSQREATVDARLPHKPLLMHCINCRRQPSTHKAWGSGTNPLTQRPSNPPHRNGATSQPQNSTTGSSPALLREVNTSFTSIHYRPTHARVTGSRTLRLCSGRTASYNFFFHPLSCTLSQANNSRGLGSQCENHS